MNMFTVTKSVRIPFTNLWVTYSRKAPKGRSYAASQGATDEHFAMVEAMHTH